MLKKFLAYRAMVRAKNDASRYMRQPMSVWDVYAQMALDKQAQRMAAAYAQAVLS